MDLDLHRAPLWPQAGAFVQRDGAHAARGEALKEAIRLRNPARRLAINYGRARLGLGSAVTLTLAADSREQGIKPLECAIGGIEAAGEAFADALGLERDPRGAGEGRGAAPTNPRQHVAPFLAIPAAHKLRGF